MVPSLTSPSTLVRKCKSGYTGYSDQSELEIQKWQENFSLYHTPLILSLLPWPTDGDYQTVADMVGGGRSRTESTTSHEESSDEAKGNISASHRRNRGQDHPPLRPGHRPSRGDPDYSYARPVKKQGPAPPPLSSTESNRWVVVGL